MKLTDSFTFKADQQAVWDILMDINAIAAALPGVDQMTPIEGESNAWRANVKLGVANISGTYSGTIKMSELTPPTQYRLTVSGEGQASVVNGSALLTLTPNPDEQTTVVSYDADAQVTGKLASIGQRLIAPAAKMLAKTFFNNLAKQIASKQAS
jgi:carbon monoxide dehydrogenase subunit G